MYVVEGKSSFSHPDSGRATPPTPRPTPTPTPRSPSPETPPEIWHEQVSFDGDGYIELDKKLVSHDPDYRLEITLEFSTRATEGLILWQGVRAVEEHVWTGEMELAEKDYMALGSEETRINTGCPWSTRATCRMKIKLIRSHVGQKSFVRIAAYPLRLREYLHLWCLYMVVPERNASNLDVL